MESGGLKLEDWGWMFQGGELRWRVHGGGRRVQGSGVRGQGWESKLRALRIESNATTMRNVFPSVKGIHFSKLIAPCKTTGVPHL